MNVPHAGHERRAHAELAGDALRRRGADDRPDPADRDRQPDRPRRESQLADDKHEVDREADLTGEVEDRDRGRRNSQVDVAGEVPQALDDLLGEPGSCALDGRPRPHGVRRNPAEEAGRGEEADRVDEDRDRRRDEADEDAREPWPDDLGGGSADLEARVALREALAWHELRQERLVADVEEHRQRPGEEADDVQLPHLEDAGEVRGGDGGQDERPADVGGDEDPPPRQTVDPDAGRQREQQERQEVDRGQHADLERARAEREDRHERHREERDLGSELADRLGQPQALEPGLAKQPGPRDERRDRAARRRTGRLGRRRERLAGAVGGSVDAVGHGRSSLRATIASRMSDESAPARRPAGSGQARGRFSAGSRPAGCPLGALGGGGVSRMTQLARSTLPTPPTVPPAADPDVVRREPRRDRRPDPADRRPSRDRDDRPADRRARRRRPPRRSTPSSQPRRRSVPTRSIPASGSSPRTPPSPRRSIAAGIRWVGPPPAAIRAMGDKAAARRLAVELGVPVVPGYDGAGPGRRDARPRGGRDRATRCSSSPPPAAAARACASSATPAELADELRGRAPRGARARSATTGSILERLVEGPRHVEVQVLFDAPRRTASISASATARSSGATRRSSRRRRRPPSDPAIRAPPGRGGARGSRGRRLRERRHLRVPPRRTAASSSSSR